MPNSPRSSKESASCRLDWRPSAWLIAGLIALGVAGAASVLLSDFPRPVAWSGAVLALLYAALLSRREAARPVMEIELDDGSIQVDGEPVEDFRVLWRGPLAFARWRNADDVAQRAVWWPDTMDAPTRRELRLAVPSQPAARQRRSVAP